MKNTKKIVAMALAVIMVFGVATTAFAAEWEWDDFNVVRNGSTGPYVRAVQNICKYHLELDNITADGDFGNNTQNAVEMYQERYLPSQVDGIVGSNTWRNMQLRLYDRTLKTAPAYYTITKAAGGRTNTQFFKYVSTGGVPMWHTYRAASGNATGTWLYIRG